MAEALSAYIHALRSVVNRLYPAADGSMWHPVLREDLVHDHAVRAAYPSAPCWVQVDRYGERTGDPEPMTAAEVAILLSIRAARPSTPMEPPR